MAAIDDLNTEIQTLAASVATLTTSVNALVAASGTNNDAAIQAATDQLKTVQTSVDQLAASLPAPASAQ